MMISQGRLSFPRFDADKLTANMNEIVRTQMRQAAREWLRAVIPRVPVWTGTSQGSLIPLARLINVALDPVPKVVRPGMGVGVGIRSAPSTEAAYFPARRKTLFKFVFKTDVAHFVYNNIQHALKPPFNLIEPTPWYATRAGNEAFAAYMDAELPKRLKRLRLRNFISYKTISYGKG